ncbi:DUF1648 domain-containing protein [Corynebacterium suranareeae]|uniref:DUF1648 domain-containing protein n=1 Tax=Corynebacterium suranareeae TaxID=2506452 RepID=UPI001E574852|nr:DUF1648 domain-containing protein [Corynebacterium suranareeae]
MNTRAEELPNLPKLPFNWTWLIATIAVTVVLVGIGLIVYYPSLPDPMPVHWNGSGEADNWSPKSVGTFLSFFLIGPGIMVLTILGMQALLIMQSQAITQRGGAKTANEAHRQWETYKATNTHIGWYMFVLNTLILVMILNEFRPHPLRGGFVIGLIGIIAATIVLLVVLGKTTTSLAKKYPMPARDGKMWGIFYNDPDDNRILVDTGMGMNYTFNIAHTWGKVLAVSLIAVPLIIVALVAFL